MQLELGMTADVIAALTSVIVRLDRTTQYSRAPMIH